MGHYSNIVGRKKSELKTQLERRGIAGEEEHSEKHFFFPGNSINRHLRREFLKGTKDGPLGKWEI